MAENFAHVWDRKEVAKGVGRVERPFKDIHDVGGAWNENSFDTQQHKLLLNWLAPSVTDC